jgi:hypothetical protein
MHGRKYGALNTGTYGGLHLTIYVTWHVYCIEEGDRAVTSDETVARTHG